MSRAMRVHSSPLLSIGPVAQPVRLCFEPLPNNNFSTNRPLTPTNCRKHLDGRYAPPTFPTLYYNLNRAAPLRGNQTKRFHDPSRKYLNRPMGLTLVRGTDAAPNKQLLTQNPYS